VQPNFGYPAKSAQSFGNPGRLILRPAGFPSLPLDKFGFIMDLIEIDIDYLIYQSLAHWSITIFLRFTFIFKCDSGYGLKYYFLFPYCISNENLIAMEAHNGA
jgi:hypothetical protein